MKKLNKSEIITLAVVFVLSIAAMLFMSAGSNTADYAVIYLDGEEVFRQSLNKSGEFTVEGINGMTFEISEHGICVVSSDCPDKLCVKCGYINRPEKSAVCMPNRVIVIVEEN